MPIHPESYIPITFLAGVYNEEQRIRYVLEHAVRWADEIIVVNKSSTDRTKEICLEYGDRVKVIDIPYSPKGNDDVVAGSKLPSNDWIYFGTASEIPTRNLIKRIRQVLAETRGELDLVYVPRKIYSFGIHSPHSRWSVGYYPFLVNRRKTIITNTIHNNFRPHNPQNTARIEFSEDCCVYHCTHATARDYMRDMTDYFQAEAASCEDPGAKIRECFANIARYEEELGQRGEALLGHYLAWPIYWLGTALFVWERQRGMDVEQYYRELRADVLRREWLECDGADSQGAQSHLVASAGIPPQAVPPQGTLPVTTVSGIEQVASTTETPLPCSEIWASNRPVTGEDDLLRELPGRPITREIKTLYVVGAHRFQERAILDRLFPNLKRIYLFEPLPELFEFLKTIESTDHRIQVFPYAISSTNGQAAFYVTDNDGASSSLIPLGKHREVFPHVHVEKTLIVQTRTLETVITERRLLEPDMLFLDVQGAEYAVLSSLSSSLRARIHIIYTEASREELYVGAKTLDDLKSLLSADYTCAGFAPLTNETPTHGNALFINRRDLNLIAVSQLTGRERAAFQRFIRSWLNFLETQTIADRRVTAGFAAYAAGDLRSARRHFLAAIWRDPSVLRNRGILSILLESVVGTRIMNCYRHWRRCIWKRA